MIDEQRFLVAPNVAIAPEKLQFVLLPFAQLWDRSNNVEFFAKSCLVEDVEVDCILELSGLVLREALVHARVVLLHVDHLRGIEVLNRSLRRSRLLVHARRSV